MGLTAVLRPKLDKGVDGGESGGDRGGGDGGQRGGLGTGHHTVGWHIAGLKVSARTGGFICKSSPQVYDKSGDRTVTKSFLGQVKVLNKKKNGATALNAEITSFVCLAVNVDESCIYYFYVAKVKFFKMARLQSSDCDDTQNSDGGQEVTRSYGRHTENHEGCFSELTICLSH